MAAASNPTCNTGALFMTDASFQPPFLAVRQLFDHLRANPDAAAALNAIYPKRGILKTAATHNSTSDQKFTIDLSPSRIRLITDDLRASLAPHGLDAVVSFFFHASMTYIVRILGALNADAGADLNRFHSSSNLNLNWRLCDYSPDTAAPQDPNGCGEHTDYGTFSIIFQDGVAGLEIENPETGHWKRVPGDTTLVLMGWCAHILSGGKIRALKHRVRRVPGVRRLSAVLFLAPDSDVVLKPVEGIVPARAFSAEVMGGGVNVGWFKEVMGKRWRWREGNEELADGEEMTQDDDIRRHSERVATEAFKRIATQDIFERVTTEHIIERVATEASRLAAYNKKSTISSRDIQTSAYRVHTYFEMMEEVAVMGTRDFLSLASGRLYYIAETELLGQPLFSDQ